MEYKKIETLNLPVFHTRNNSGTMETDCIYVVNVYNEREDFMMDLFGISGRTQESIDYWGE